ncbi:hypothetical protein J2850_005238 [Azospirillum picis]|uniref:Uncharacterized protein n=2 Tax=Azospirillum picis TaxID=488438 RepID=A0ABU0MRZ1_9PROT|nr:hypothetical protein [Azospirillum picis]MBP2302499.1 hypothetical protein [Azospirillum picis]MDQ0536259.1 hypothetical protein [Azospirillum picis]
MYGVKGYAGAAEVPSVVLKVRAPGPERAIALASEREMAAGLRLEAIEIGGALSIEGVMYEGPWPWLNKKA